jgi:hypothetical protein
LVILAPAFAVVSHWTTFAVVWFQSQQEAKIPLERLDGPARARVLAVFAGLIILGLGMMALTWLGARVTKRYMHPKSHKPVRRRSSAPAQDDWASKPLVELDPGNDTGDGATDGATDR